MTLHVRSLRRATPWLLALCAIGCQSSSLPWGSRGSCPVELVASERVPPGTLRLRIHLRPIAASDSHEAGETGTGLEAVVESREGTVTIVGFTPFGTLAFSIVQTGTAFELDDGIARHLGMRPLWVLDALHRGLWIDPDDARQASPVHIDVERSGPSGERVVRVRNPKCGYVARVAVAAQEPRADAAGAR